MQWPKEKKGQKFGDTKWVIRSRKQKKDRQYNGQKKKDKNVLRYQMGNKKS